ncbi:polysaccharide biosynthesis protein [Filimonas lacunae]|nr:hypothetical protein [Filimonas lacunae]BAV04285.1 polysaccharide biosynthesis protein [Filimonas lacunae]
MALIPIYLSHWSVNVYGIWLAIQALVTVLSTLDKGHQNYLGFEFLKIGADKKKELSINLWSSIEVGLWTGLLEVLVIAGIVYSGLLMPMLGETSADNSQLVKDAGIVLLLQGIIWWITGSIGGILVRSLSPFGYYARMSWWGVWSAVITSIAPLIPVIMGKGLLEAGIAMAVATVVYNIPMFFDMFRLLKKEGVSISFSQKSSKLGWRNFFHSLALSGKDLLENLRQQGIRVILAPLSGATAMAAFSTIRTGANIALQGLGTLTNPLMPELMRFLNQRDQERMEASFGTVWMVLIAILTPGVLILQAFAPALFHVWTKGKITFDPLLFAILSLGVLVYAQAQPAMTIMRGNNLLRSQLIISILSALVVLAGMFTLVPMVGIVGAGIALLASELVATQGYKMVAHKWLVQHGLKWPAQASRIAHLSVLIATVFSTLMVLFPQHAYIILVVSLIAVGINVRWYWKRLPVLVIQKTNGLLKKIPVMGKLIKA